MRWLATLLVLYSAQAFGQTVPTDPRERRALRERAVFRAGTEARPLVESDWGDQAALVLLKVSRANAAKLIACNASVSRISRTGDVLLSIAKHGDDVCEYVTGHADELADPDCCDAFLADPLTFALGLRKIQVAAAERRAMRLSEPAPPSRFDFLDALRRNAALMGGIVLVSGGLLWFRRRRGP